MQQQKKKIYARGFLKILLWDFERMLNDKSLNCLQIKNTLTKQLNKLKNKPYQEVDWK